jgi:hypothetical protein
MRHFGDVSAFLRSTFFCVTISLVTTLMAQDGGSLPDSSAASDDPQVDREILFTSKLMGYFRMPDHQPYQRTPSDPRCPVTWGDASPDARIFIENFRNRPRNTLLVGTGDNFAPNYYSRVLHGAPRVAPDGTLRAPGKELYQWDEEKWTWYQHVDDFTNAKLQLGVSTLPTDNVGCFLSYVGYDALVPGKHDFYYGPEHLRQLARFIAGPGKRERDPNNDREFPPVQMLAANMMIKTTWANDHAPIPDSGKLPLPFATKYAQLPPPSKDDTTNRCKDPSGENYCAEYRKLEIVDFTDSGFAFPWMRFVRINATGSWRPEFLDSLEVYLCEAVSDDPDDFLGHDGFCKDQHRLGPDTRATDAAQKESGPEALVYKLPEADFLRPGHNYAICIAPPEKTVDQRHDTQAAETKPYCLRFAVYDPFFQYPNWNDAKHSDPAERYKNPDLWVVKEGDGKTPVVIFGVVDPQLQEHVGGDNFAWRTVKGTPGTAKHDKRYTTQLTIADPVRALIHLQDYFEDQYHREHGQDFQGIRVLLAQMSPEAVKQLAEHLPSCLRFDVIVSAADDALATPNQKLEYFPGHGAGNGGCEARAGASGLKMKGTDELMNGSLAIPTTFVAVPPSHEQPPALPLNSVPGNPKSRVVQARKLHITGSRPNLIYSLKGHPLFVPPSAAAQSKVRADRFWSDVWCSIYEDDHTKKCPIQGEPKPAASGDQAQTTAISKPTTSLSWDSDAKKRALQQLVLWSIRERYKTDVALLQERDFYLHGLDDYLAEYCQVIDGPDGKPECDPHYPAELDTQEILDRILWKGDYIQVRSVQGSVLKSVLKESSQFSKAEKIPYSPIGESGRALVKLGIQPDEKNGGDYLINDKPLDPGALYTVATSDYIGLGDTGYPELPTPPVGTAPPPASEFGEIVTVSGSTCQTLTKSVKGCSPPLHLKDYYDELVNQTPDDPRKGNTSWRKFYAWTYLHRSLGQPPPKHKGLQAPPGSDDITARMQEKVDAEKNWDFSLDKASVGFTALTHNGGEQELSQNFGGVANGDVNARHAHSWAWDLNSKVTLFHTKYDLFASEGMQYTSSFTAQSSGPRSESQSRNQFTVEGGSYLRPWRKDKKLWQLSGVLAGHFETQLANPLTNITLSPVPPSTSSSQLFFKQGRTRLLLGRTGARFQDRKSFVEAGLEGGATLNNIESFSALTAPGGPTATCFLQATFSLTKCLNQFNKDNPETPVTSKSQVTVNRSLQPRYGVYWNMGMTVPINPTISYNFTDASDYFFNSSGDNSTDTRFRHTLVHTLKFTVLPNLSFEPTYTIFLYQNKLDYNFLFQQQYAVKINYSFDWANWHERKQQLQYKKSGAQ